MMHLLGAVGLLLIFLGEGLSFFHIPPWSQYVFPLFWYGYILLLDSLNYRLKGNSLISSRPWEFCLMLPISAFYWYLFEWYNLIIQNWIYINTPPEKWIEIPMKIVSFATVIPALYETKDILRALPWTKNELRTQPLIPASWHAALPITFILGFLLSFLPLIYPKLFFWSVWLGFFLLLDPINHWLGHPSIIRDWQEGELRRTFILLIAGYICGFFWEFWNYWAYTKWIYTVPIPQMPHIFEMPILGFLGFGPFGLETFAFWTLIWRRRNNAVKLYKES